MVNNPLPTDLASECKKASKILNSFIDPSHAGGIDSVVPPTILKNAKGFAIYTVLKAGFVWSGRAGSGLVVARLPDGSWSAPSCIATAGVGVGGQIGAQLTDHLVILNTPDAVKAFSQGGNVTLGGNLSIAAGPVGRSAEAAGAVGHLAAIYSYSKSKGLFAGISIEGSVLVERSDANQKFYGRKIKAKELLGGGVPPPAQASALYAALNAKASGGASPLMNVGSASSLRSRPSDATAPTSSFRSRLSDTSAPASSLSSRQDEAPPSYHAGGFTMPQTQGKRPPPPVPPKPSTKETVVALYDYTASQGGDLSFCKGDIITIIKKTASQDDWWRGSLHGQEGDFPGNYVQLRN